MDLQIGSNLYRNTDGTVEVEGVPQLTVALRKPEGPLLVNFVLFDEVGRVIAKVVDSSLAFNVSRIHELTKTPNSLVLKNTESGKVVLHLEVKQPGLVVLKQGIFTTIKGHTMEVTPSEWRVNNLRMNGVESDQKGGPVSLG